MPITSLITSSDWNSVAHLSTEPYCCNVQVTAVGINTEWGLLMASISEDSGEETPLQVWFCCCCCQLLRKFIDLTCLCCSGAGPFEWCLYFHWNGWTFCCPCSSGCTVGQVKLPLYFSVLTVYFVYLHQSVPPCFLVGTSLGILIILMDLCNMWKGRWVV